ncbi:MAG TPA: polysulfide reductase NrfD [Bacteroidales bacterium]|nr:polysulfide reductase NrfD [Bacteroidales bacterium]HPS50208.1 polysulfide reductase NrfD [Bacteroidales bacterium]
MAEKDFTLEKITGDLTHHIRLNKGFLAWMGFLTISLLVCLYAYSLQLKNGLGVAGIRDYVSWGMYLSNFVFFVASSLIGMLISAFLGLIGMKWITPLTRIAETIAVAFAAVAGLVIVSDMGRPERLANVFIYARFQSPILWDVTVITTYFVLSLLLLFLPMIADLAIIQRKVTTLPAWLRTVYKVLSLNYRDTPEQNRIIHRSIRILLILIIPAALSIHTVTSWLFAVTSRAGWDSTIFGPYFVSGAFVAGTAAVILAMFFFRKNYKLSDYLTDLHFNNMGKVLATVSLVYLYFNLNEFLVPGYKLKRADAVHLHELLAGKDALLFWFVQIGGLLLPILFMLFRRFRKPVPITIIAVAVLIAAWFKRYLIVIPTQEHPFLPIQHVPDNFIHYTPTLTEALISIAPFLLVLIIITLILKFFPVIPLQETAKEKGVEPFIFD